MWTYPPKPCVIDIYQGDNIQDPAELRAAGIVGVIHKASQYRPDPAYARRRTWMAPVIGLWGAYHFAVKGGVKAQVQLFMDSAQPSDETLLALDLETPDPARPAFTAMPLEEAREFLQRLLEATRRQPADVWIYGGNYLKEQIKTQRDLEFFGMFNLWMCQYASRFVLPRAWNHLSLWQYSEKGRLQGSVGNVDLNAFDGNLADLREVWAPGTRSRTTHPAPAPAMPAPVPATVKVPAAAAPIAPSGWDAVKHWFWTH